MRVVPLFALLPLLAQDNAPRSKAADYAAHVSLTGMEIGAEYLLHSIPTENGFYIAKDYLVVDVGIFPSTLEKIKISSGQFQLRINHGQPELLADTPGSVAGSVKYPDWEQQRKATVIGQAGPVIVGAPQQTGRFPGDPTGQPIPIPAPERPDPSGAEPRAPKSVDEMIAHAALPEFATERPAKGCLFFHYRGKTKSIHSLELIYDGGEGRPKATIPLF
jgi:hypothetical protein